MANGTVKWFDSRKGFGFIIDENGRDWFCHHTAIQSNDSFKLLVEGSKVEFTEADSAKGPCATDVKVTELAEVKKDDYHPDNYTGWDHR